jgi:uncharacterized protein (TIGR03437 family)
LKKTNLILASIIAFAAAGALSAQSVTVSPTSLTFSALSGSTSAQNAPVTVTGGTATLLAQALTNVGGWLRVCSGSPCTVATSTTIIGGVVTVIADPTGLSVGSYSGTVSILDSSTLKQVASVPVTLTVAPIGVSPSSLTFNYQIGSSSPTAQNLTLTSAANTAYTTSLSGADCGWLIQPPGGISPGLMTVSINTAALPSTPGTHSCNLQILSGGQTITVPVTLTVTAAPNVTVSPTAVNLVYQVGGASGSTNSPSQTLTLTNPGSQDLSYLISPSQPWIVVNAAQGVIKASSSTQVTVSYLTSTNLAASATPYSASLGILVVGAATPNTSVPVSLTISNSPLLNVPTSTVAFNYQVGGSIPAAKAILPTSTAADINSPTNQTPLILQSTTASGGNWIASPPPAPSSISGQTGTSFSIALNPSVVASLSPGTYNGTVLVAGLGSANAPDLAHALQIPVTLIVSNDPLVTVSFGGCTQGIISGLTCPMQFLYQVGQNNPIVQTVTVASSNGAALNSTPTVSMTQAANCTPNWLSVGQITAGVNNTTTFVVTANPAGIPNGTACAGTVTVTATNPTSGNASPNSPQQFPVALYVNNAAMVVPNAVALNFTAAPNSIPPTQTLIVNSTGTSASDQLNFTISTPSTAPWLLAAPTNRNTAAGTNQVSVAVNPNGLAPGTYVSQITIASTALDSLIGVPVTLTVTAATMTVDKTSLTFNQTLGGQVPASQNVIVSATGGTVAYNTAISYQSGQATGWLNATPTSGTIAAGSTSPIQVSVNGSSLAAGTYNGTVTISASGVTGSPTAVNVTLVVSPGTLSVTPASLTFTEVQGTSAQSQNLTVSGTPGALNFSAATQPTGSWLSATANTTTTPATVQVTAANTGLNPGTYNGTVTITSPGANGSPQTVNVTLTVVAAQTITVTPTTLNFSYTIGTAAPTPQSVHVTASGGSAQFTATASPTAPWLVVSQPTNSTPADLSVGINATGLAAGTYTGTISITSPSSATTPAASITVNLTIVAVPTPIITAIQNAASATVGPISPGENIVLYGTNIGPAGTTPVMGNIVNGALATTVAQTQVLFDGVAAPIYYTSTGQTSVFVPYGIAGRATTQIVVSVQGVKSNPIAQSVTSTVPGVYTLNSSGSGPAVAWNYALNGNYTGINSASNPVVKGGVVSLYLTGEGVTTAPPGLDGAVVTNLYKPLATVTATVGGQPATVQYAGSAPGSIYGVMQVNVQIPASIASGAQTLVVNVGGNNSQSNVTISVQ